MIHVTHCPWLHSFPVAAQLVHEAPHLASVSQARHFPASQVFPLPQSPSTAHARQAPFAQPFGQVTGISVYVQFPSAQVPTAPCVSNVLPSAQTDGGGVWQVTPTQALPTHASF